MSAEGFEKTRIQNPDEAHEEANMLRVEVGEGNPTAADYDEALALLEGLQEEAQGESPAGERASRALKDILAAITSGTGAVPELLGLALASVGTAVGPYPKHMSEETRNRLIERFERIGDDYKMIRSNMSSARETLEKWRAEAKEIS